MEFYYGTTEENDFLTSRRAVIEPEAEENAQAQSDPSEEENGGQIQQEDNISFDARKVIIPKKRRSSHAAAVLLALCAVSAAIGFVYSSELSGSIPSSVINDYLTMRIKGGFFENAAASFIGSLIWLAVPFVMGLCAVGQPVTIAVILFKGVGIGVTASAFIGIYGLNGVPAMLAWVLPSALFGTAITAYQCKNSLSCSCRIFSYITGRFTDARPSLYYSGYISKSVFCAVCCFLLGIAEATLSVVLGGMFVI